MKNFKLVLKIVENLIFAILLLLALLVVISLLPIENNYKLYSVMSGSMEPTIGVGTMIVSQLATSYHVDNIITFNEANSTNKTTTHRIVEIQKENGEKTYQTKGDANESVDRVIVDEERIIGRYLFGIPLIGYLIGYIKTLPGLILIIIIPTTIIIYEEVKKIKVEGKKIVSDRAEKKKERKGKDRKW